MKKIIIMIFAIFAIVSLLYASQVKVYYSDSRLAECASATVRKFKGAESKEDLCLRFACVNKVIEVRHAVTVYGQCNENSKYVKGSQTDWVEKLVWECRDVCK